MCVLLLRTYINRAKRGFSREYVTMICRVVVIDDVIIINTFASIGATSLCDPWNAFPPNLVEIIGTKCIYSPLTFGTIFLLFFAGHCLKLNLRAR